MVLFGLSFCIREFVVVFGQIVVLGENGCVRNKRLYSEKSSCIRAKWLYSGRSGCIRTKVLVL